MKSADAVAARLPSVESRPCQQAPLCPRKVPILRTSSADMWYVEGGQLCLPIARSPIAKHRVVV